MVTDIDVSIDAQRPAGTHGDYVGGGGVCLNDKPGKSGAGVGKVERASGGDQRAAAENK